MGSFVTRNECLVQLIPTLNSGGAERLCVELSNEATKHYKRVIIITFNATGSKNYTLNSNVEIIQLQSHKLLRFIQLGNLLRMINKQIPIRHVISHLNGMNRLLMRSRIILNLKKATYTLVEHNNFYRSRVALVSNTLIRVALYYETKILYSLSDRVVSVSKGVKNSVDSFLKLQHSNHVVILNGINKRAIDCEKKTEKLNHVIRNMKQNSCTIIMASRLVKQKNIILGLQAFRAALDSGLPVSSHLYVLGDGPERLELEQYIREAELQDRVTLVGNVPNPFAYYVNSDIFLLSSNWEGYPLVLLEAMYSGLNVVSTDCEFGPSEILGPEYPYLADCNNIQMLSQKLVKMHYEGHPTPDPALVRDTSQVARDYFGLSDEK